MDTTKPTLKEISRRLNISAMTVSLVLSGKSAGRVSADLAEKIRQTAKEMGYRENRLAQAIRTGIVPLIALCIYEANDGSASPNLYWFDIIGSAKRTFAAEKVEVLFITYSSVEEFTERISSLRDANMIGGVISNLAIPGKTHEICDFLKNCGLPCAVFGDPAEDTGIPYSTINSAQMEADMLAFLRQKGATELKWFSRQSPLPDADDAANDHVFFHVSSELSRTKLIELAGVPAERIVIVSHYISDLGGHQGFLVKSHSEERCLHALRAIQQQTRKEKITEFSKIINLTGSDMTWVEPISKNRSCK